MATSSAGAWERTISQTLDRQLDRLCAHLPAAIERGDAGAVEKTLDAVDIAGALLRALVPDALPADPATPKVERDLERGLRRLRKVLRQLRRQLAPIHKLDRLSDAFARVRPSCTAPAAAWIAGELTRARAERFRRLGGASAADVLLRLGPWPALRNEIARREVIGRRPLGAALAVELDRLDGLAADLDTPTGRLARRMSKRLGRVLALAEAIDRARALEPEPAAGLRLGHWVEPRPVLVRLQRGVARGAALERLGRFVLTNALDPARALDLRLYVGVVDLARTILKRADRALAAARNGWSSGGQAAARSLRVTLAPGPGRSPGESSQAA
jgi:hypothetical protein